MRNILLFFVVLCYLTSCNTYDKNIKDNSSDKKIRKQALLVAENYSKGQIKDVKKSINKDGIIKLSGKGIAYYIDPSRIIMGEINEDSFKDAIVPLYVYREQSPPAIQHLVLINIKGKLINIKEMDNVLKVIGIKDRTIFVEVSTVDRDSPTYGCELCREVIKYQFRGDTLSIIK